MNIFFQNLDIGWRSYELFSLPNSSYPHLAFFYFWKTPLIVYPFKFRPSLILEPFISHSILRHLSIQRNIFSYAQKRCMWLPAVFWFHMNKVNLTSVFERGLCIVLHKFSFSTWIKLTYMRYIKCNIFIDIHFSVR